MTRDFIKKVTSTNRFLLVVKSQVS